MILGWLNKFRYDLREDRLGPDLPFTHYKLYRIWSMHKLCKKKFQYFGSTSEFKPGAYAISCSKISIGRRA